MERDFLDEEEQLDANYIMQNENFLTSMEESDINKEENNIENTESIKSAEESAMEFIKEIQKKFEQEKSAITLVIDRFEGDIAVCENRETEEISNIKIEELPEEIHEGDVLKFNGDKYEIDEQAKMEIQERIKNKIKNIFEEN